MPRAAGQPRAWQEGYKSSIASSPAGVLPSQSMGRNPCDGSTPIADARVPGIGSSETVAADGVGATLRTVVSIRSGSLRGC
jgi:hypothetical protein